MTSQENEQNSVGLAKKQTTPAPDIDLEIVLGKEFFKNLIKEEHASKYAISTLEKMLEKEGIIPNYEQASTVSYDPTFRYLVKFTQKGLLKTFSGDGNSVEQAKNAAAQAALYEINKPNIVDKFENKTKNDTFNGTIPKSTIRNTSSFRDNIPNPIGLLQELCMTNAWALPIYKIINEGGMPNETEFIIYCTVPGYCGLGKGKTKKTAKTAAARVALYEIHKANIMDMFESKTKNDTFNRTIPKSTIRNTSSFKDNIPNPIGLLQELCMTNAWALPIYKIINEEGMPHETEFTICCTVPGYCGIGKGKTKNKAKTTAARVVLYEINKANLMDKFVSKTRNDTFNGTIPKSKIRNTSSFKDNIPNPIGLLQELCMTSSWALPIYKVINEEGMAHETEFTICCTVPGYCGIGKGKTKNKAKTTAARVVLYEINKANLMDKFVSKTRNDTFNGTIPKSKIRNNLSFEDDIHEHPIDSVQELHILNPGALPIKESISDKNIPEKRLFPICCTI